LADAGSTVGPRAALPRVLTAALELAPRVGEAFALDMLSRVAPVLEGLPDTPEEPHLLEKALFVAAHFGQTEQVQTFVARFRQLLDRRRGEASARAFESLAEMSFRGLRKLGMRDEIDRLLQQMAECL